MTRAVAAGAVAIAFIAAVGTVEAADPRHPDWPCPQVKVPTLSIAAFWTDPPIDGVGDAWKSDQAIRDLVLQLAARRTPLEEAALAARAFVTGSPEEKRRKAALLFAGLFTTLNAERTHVMDGIERFARRQKALRDKIRNELAEMQAHHNTNNRNSEADATLTNKLAWDTRVFEERRNTIGFVCEVPALIERRLFALSRSIQGSLD